jgi:hypothetical protein
MWKKFLPIAGLALAATYGANAQDPARSLLGSFPKSIVVKVYEVSSIIKMDKEEQYKLAMAYNRQDSLVAAAIAEGRPAAEIDSLDRTGITILQRVLTQPQLINYCEHKGREFSDVAAAGELAYLKEEYHPDSVTYRAMQGRMATKYDYIYQNYLLEGMEKGKMEKNIAKLAGMFDNYEFYPMLYSNKFATDYLEKLNAVKKIPDTTCKRIRAMFNGMIIANKFTDWATAINRSTQYYLPDTAVFSALFRPEFEKQAFELSASDSYNLIKLQRLTKGAYDSVYGLVSEKNYKRAVLQYAYATYHYKQFDTLISQTSHYYDSLIQATLLRNGALQNGSQFALALKYKDLLGLRYSLTDTLLDQVMYLNARRDSILSIDPDAPIDFGPYESAHLSQLLTLEQYNLLLSYKNRAQAIYDANADWNEMELRGITAGLNKDDVVRQISSYYILKYNAWNRLAHDKIALWATQRVIGEGEPEPLKILNPLRWNGDTTKSSNNLKLQW